MIRPKLYKIYYGKRPEFIRRFKKWARRKLRYHIKKLTNEELQKDN